MTFAMEVVFSIFLFALAIGYVEYRLKTIRKDDSDDKKDAFDFFATKDELKKAVKKIHEKIDENHVAQEERMESIEQKAFYAAEEKKKQAEKQQKAASKPDAGPSVVFFRWPDDDCTFDNKLRSATQTEDTYYRFQLDASRTRADFTFVTMSDTQLSKANNSSKKYIERACNFAGTKSSQYSCTPGKAHLERGKWIIDLKARIDYK